MYPPDHYHSMTDDQLAQWHQLTTRCEELQRDLETSRAATEAVQAHAEVERSQLRGRLLLLEREVLTLVSLHKQNEVATRRLSAQQVQILSALDALVKLVTGGRVSNDQHQWPGEVYRAVQNAEEVLRLCGFPF